MFRNFTLIISVLFSIFLGACADSLPGTLPTTGIDATVTSVDSTTTDTSQFEPDLGTPTAGLDIEDSEPDIWTEEDTSVNEDASFEDTSVVEDNDFEEDASDTTAIDYCQPASTDCNDNDPTTEDFCSPLDRKCKNLGCATDCNDSNVCTTDSCVNGQCVSLEIAGCFPCSDESACAYGVNPKIPDYGFYCDFTAGVCAHITDQCATNADCEDGDPCTNNICSPAYQAGGVLVCGTLPPIINCGKPCLSNTNCYADDLTCQEGTCKPATFSKVLGDGNVCETQSDCAQSPWGKNCTPSAAPNMPSLCQECKPKDADGDGIHDGCIAEHPYCGWGLSWDDPATGDPRSVYQCE